MKKDKLTRDLEDALNSNSGVQQFLREQEAKRKAARAAYANHSLVASLNAPPAPKLKGVKQPKSLPGQLSLFE